MVNIKNVRIVTIKLKPFKGDKCALLKAINDLQGEDEKLTRLFHKTNYCWDLDKSVELRLFTPADVGYTGAAYCWSISDLTDKTATESMNVGTVARLVLELPKIKENLPPELLKSEWWVHAMGEKCEGISEFIVGMGTPVSYLSVLPFSAKPLQVSLVWGGRREGFRDDTPVLTQCK
jgi:hypothetical protein